MESPELAAFPDAINIRNAFRASQGMLLMAADYSQIELRILAHLSGDEGLINLLRLSAAGGGDIFRLIASSMLKIQGEVMPDQRNRAKRVCYAIIYGQGIPSLAKGLGLPLEEAEKLREDFFLQFPGIQTFVTKAKEEARNKGYAQTHFFGRRRAIRGMQDENVKVREAALRKAVNTPIQGSAADLVKLAMCRWEDWLRKTRPPPPLQAPRLLAMVHDELLIEFDARADVPQLAEALQSIMCDCAPSLSVPLLVNVEVGSTWGAMRKVGPV